MLTPSGDVKVMDFGIARAISDASSTMTQTAAVVGTAQYLSPEQARGETVDSRSDVYCAGCLLYELLTGRPPFVGDSPVAVAYQHVREQPQPPSDHDADLPPEIDAIVLKSLAKRVEDRYQSAAAMRNDIERYLDGRPISVVAPSPTSVQPPAPQAGTHAAATAVVPPVAAGPPSGPIALEEEYDDYGDGGSRTGLIVTIGLIVIALIAAGYFIWPKLFPGAPEKVQVPNLVKLSQDQASTTLAAIGLVAHVSDWQPSEDIEAGSVVSQDPPADSYVEPNTTVEIVLSSGKPQVELLDLGRMQYKDAKQWLTDHSLLVKKEDRESDEQKGLVLEMNPPSGTSVEENSSVTLYVSLGPKSVPSVVGLTQAKAEEAIRNAGFIPQTKDEPNTTDPKGTVTSQFPAADTPANQDSTVLIFVSTYEPPPMCEYDPSIPADDPGCVPPPSCITPTPGVQPQPTDPPFCADIDPTTWLPIG